MYNNRKIKLHAYQDINKEIPKYCKNKVTPWLEYLITEDKNTGKLLGIVKIQKQYDNLQNYLIYVINSCNSNNYNVITNDNITRYSFIGDLQPY